MEEYQTHTEVRQENYTLARAGEIDGMGSLAGIILMTAILGGVVVGKGIKKIARKYSERE
jgi:hypothetical protein